MSIQAIIQINIEIVLVILCVSIWILTMVWKKDSKQVYRYIWIVDLLTVGLLVSDIFAIFYRGNMSPQGYYIVRAANFFNFLFLYSILFYLSFFVEKVYELKEKGKKRILTTKIMSGITIMINFVNLVVPLAYDFDEQNKYFRKGGWYVNAAFQLIAIIFLASVVIELRNEIEQMVSWMILIEIIMPLLASIVQIFIYGIAITNIALGVTQIILFMVLFRYQELKIQKRDLQISEYNAKLMLTQLQPHFMLNTLSTIQYLCKSDSEAAYETISDFSIYLRNNMEFASTTDLIPFEKELSHIEKYVAIEQKRFGERIKAKYDIKEKEFSLPPLSVQPLVENAIKHGISKKRQGGTVEISTWRSVKDIHIIIRDDGVGYDMDKPFSSDRVHLGLSLVRDRLQRMCGGDVMITSEENKGTICEIIIPIEFNV